MVMTPRYSERVRKSIISRGITSTGAGNPATSTAAITEWPKPSPPASRERRLARAALGAPGFACKGCVGPRGDASQLARPPADIVAGRGTPVRLCRASGRDTVNAIHKAAIYAF